MGLGINSNRNELIVHVFEAARQFRIESKVPIFYKPIERLHKMQEAMEMTL